ncbi:MAG TPA: hypothetical protein DEF00_03415 [Candidatus Taylorbacteria bacterium]|nr:MAG: hypothetical protein UY03_C0025G0007 [Parcubacteria group bacterium GW2011_GWA2_47_64]KKU96875.1 MAG: hypothetical protein UY29_C0005G0008 [Parcubacteria group bacterium GW2011_GWC2_48_17]HBV01412.1 hypothetical protein [Candidatus Taylorbacteria bacterium]
MKKKKQKIAYDKESKVLSIELRNGKSVDSDIHDNLVIDYDRQGRVVRVNLYDIDFASFRDLRRKRIASLSHLGAPILVK